MTDTITAEIASKVRGIKGERNLSQERIAGIIGVSDRKSVGARLHGTVPFTAAELFRFAAATDVPIERLYPSAAATGAGE